MPPEPRRARRGPPAEVPGDPQSNGEVKVLALRRVPVHSSTDIVIARQEGRALAAAQGFTAGDLTLIATAISEVARNIVEYAKKGEIILQRIEEKGRRGLVVVARDNGPGIRDVPRALEVGFSTGNGLGLGLPGVRRLMDSVTVASLVGKGTTVTMTKWEP